MAKKPDSFKFTLRELAGLLLKDADIHEGLWHLQVGFAMTAAEAGPSPEMTYPAGIVGVSEISIVRADKPGNLVFDAAKINPEG